MGTGSAFLAGSGIRRSSAALAATPKAVAPPTQTSESRQTRVNFIVGPTLPLKTKVRDQSEQEVTGSPINKAIWWQNAPIPVDYVMGLMLSPRIPHVFPLFRPVPDAQGGGRRDPADHAGDAEFDLAGDRGRDAADRERPLP